MKRTELFFSVLLLPVDFSAVLLGTWLAHRLRLTPYVTDIRPILYDVSGGAYMFWAAIVSLLAVVIFAVAGLYGRRSSDAWFDEFVRIVLASSTVMSLVVFVVFFRPELFSSRFIVLTGWACSIVTVSTARLLVRRCRRLLFRYGFAARRLAIVGGAGAADVAERIHKHPEGGYRVYGVFSPDALGREELRARLVVDDIDDVFFIEPNVPAERLVFLELAQEYHAGFRYVPDLLNAGVGTPTLSVTIGVPVVEVHETTVYGWGRVAKRTFDICVALSLLLFFSPLFLLLSVAVVFNSGFPIFYLSTRVGRGRRFTIYKFRSMHVRFSLGEQYGGPAAQALYDELVRTSSDRSGPVPKVANDPRVTLVGRFLRRYSLDELPQLLNVLLGDMSLVGPRPHFPWEVERYARHHRKVLAVKPGMTGLAQVSGRSDLDFEDEVRLDRYYLEHWNFGVDIRILLQTIPVLFRSRRVL